MESEDPDPLDASSTSVLEYYRKYSQDKKLATYFCGDVTLSECEHEKSREHVPRVTVTDVTYQEGEETIAEEPINISRPPLIGQDKYDNVGLDDSENEIVRASSPSSSIASNRKLEWDSGADIGYENVQKQKFLHKNLHKSLSLPTLASSDKLELNKTLLRLSPEGKVTESSTQTQLKESSSESSNAQSRHVDVPSSSSSSKYPTQNVAQVIHSSSSSSYASKPQDVVSSTESECDSEVKSNVLDFLNKKVGLPVAASTPVYKVKEINVTVLPSVSALQNVGTARSTNSNVSGKTFTSVISVVDNLKQINNGFDIISYPESNGTIEKPIYSDLNDQGKAHSLIYMNEKLKRLCVTSPLIVECLESLVGDKKALDKVIQTVPISYVSIGVQTETDDRSVLQNVKTYPTERQGLIYFHHSDTDKEPSSRTLGTNTFSNATDEDVSNCNSFEYLYGDQHEVARQDVAGPDVNQSLDSSTPNEINVTNGNNLKRTQARSDLNVVSPDSVRTSNLNKMTSSSHTNPLGELIAREQSNDSEVDVSKNIDLIKKLIKSKKYDKITKQYYIKKIVQTILNSNENSETSANSDMTSEEVSDKTKVNSVNNVEDLALGSKQRNLQENLPWVPAQLSNEQLEVRTFSTEILPASALFNDDCKFRPRSSQIKKNSVFTLPNCKNSEYHKPQSSSDHSSSKEANGDFQHVSPQFSLATLEQDSDYVDKVNSFQNWKEAKTLSEEKLEQEQAMERDKKNCGAVESHSNSESDVLLNFAKKERENQLNWINNEIVHLSKLKQLLQKKEYKMSVDVLTKPEMNDMPKRKKSTSVYVITTEKPESPKNTRKPIEQSTSSNESARSRKDTINVKIASHKHEPIWYKNGQRYGRKTTTQCKCDKPKASNQVWTNETCLYSRLRKASPRRTKEISQKETRHLNLCRCTETKVNDKICFDGTCPHLTSKIRKSSPQRTKESSQKEIPLMTLNDEVCSDETSRYLTPSRARKSSPRRTQERTDKLNDDGGITRLTLNSELQQAKLISSELYSNELNPHACIRRYVFEIPLTPVLHGNRGVPNLMKDGESKHVKDKLVDEVHTEQQVVFEEKMRYPDKSYNENTAKDQVTYREPDYMVTGNDEKSERVPRRVDSSALTEIYGDHGRYNANRNDISDRKVENISLSSYGVTEIYRDDGTRDLAKHDRHTSSVASQTTILDTHKSDSENLHKRRTKGNSVIEVSANDRPRTGTYSHKGKDDMREVNLQKIDVSDKYIETDKVKTTTGTETKEPDHRVKYNSRTRQGDEHTNNLKTQKIIGSEYNDVKLNNMKGISAESTKWNDRKGKMQPEYNVLKKYTENKAPIHKRLSPEYKKDYVDSRSEDEEELTGSENIDELNDQRGRFDQKETIGLESDVQRKKLGLEYRDGKSEDQRRQMGLEYERSKSEEQAKTESDRMRGTEYRKINDQKERMESDYRESEPDQERGRRLQYENRKFESRKGRTGSEYKYSKSDDQEESIESEYQDSTSNDQQKVIELEYEERIPENSKMTGSEYKYRKLDDRKTRKRIDSGYKNNKREHQREKKGVEYEDTKSDDQNSKGDRRVATEYKNRRLEQDRPQRKILSDGRGGETSSEEGENVDYADKFSQYVGSEMGKTIEESTKRTSRRRDLIIDNEKGDVYTTKENKQINTEETMHVEKESNDKVTQTTLIKADKRDLSSSLSTSSTSETESSTGTARICPCCKKNKSRASALMSNLQRDIQPLLCQPCYTQNRQNNSYRHPGHICNCYTVLKTETVRQIKKTVDELGDLEREYCTCSINNKNVEYCQCKRNSYRKKAVAYMLTFEQGSNNESNEEIRQRSSLEEVKVKIPYPHKKKRNKDYENKRKKAKKHHHHNSKKHQHPQTFTLQEHLGLNRPNFIDNAEQRRKCMIELAYMREQRCEKYKQLLALTNGLPPPSENDNDLKAKRVFTSRKMKEITAQNYKKLPEVQQKLKDNRDKQIKKANRLLADIFNKKLRENVLRGRHTLSTSTSVIKLV